MEVAVPERLDDPVVRAMLAALEQVDGEPVVLHGAPERFCLGMNVETAPPTDEQRAVFTQVIARLLRCPRPTLAVVDGPALGGGLGLAAACDYVLATPRARFGLPEALHGLVPALIRPALRTRLSPQRLRMLLFTCYSRSAEEAMVLGLVDRIVDVDELGPATRNTIRQLARARTESVIACRAWEDA
jgi:enoyl-CoA hydratase/carnithine racemase